MTFEEYQKQAIQTKTFPDLIIRPLPYDGSEFFYEDDEEVRHLQSKIDDAISLSWIYPALGLAGEAGEVLEKLKKAIRDKQGYISESDLLLIKKELGDVLWYVATLSSELGLSLDDVATTNLNKVKDRKRRGTTSGSGDER